MPTETEEKIRTAIETVLNDNELLYEAGKCLDEETCLQGVRDLTNALTKAVMDLRGKGVLQKICHY